MLCSKDALSRNIRVYVTFNYSLLPFRHTTIGDYVENKTYLAGTPVANVP
jgi:hypothetical protein